MGLWQLRLAMIGTLGFIIGASTLFFTVLMLFIGAFSFITVAFMVVGFNIIQWLISPMLINALYRVKTITRQENPKLYGMVERLAQRARLNMPRVGIANIPIPNAFAYSSPFGGARVAVTEELLQKLEDEEVEAVIGHELGHLKHRDVQVMMFVSVLPAIFYFIGYSFLLSGMFGGGGRGRNGGGGGMIIGAASLALYFVLSLFVLYISRLREYYADRHSAGIVDDGARKLSEGLAKIVVHSGRYKKYHGGHEPAGMNSFRTLFIADPTHAAQDTGLLRSVGSYRSVSDQQLVQEVASQRLTTADRLLELFTTHPNIVKRLSTLQRLHYRMET